MLGILRNQFRRGVALAALLCLFLFFVLSYFLLPSFSGLTWNGYYTVLLDGREDLREAGALLEAGGVKDVVCASTARVEFSDFDRMEEATALDLPSRLKPEDPRLDDFLRGAASLFRTANGSHHILYVPARESPLCLALKFMRALPSKSWSFLEWNLGKRLVLLFLYVSLVFSLTLRDRALRPLIVLLSLPWLNFFIHGNPSGFAAGCLLYIGCTLFLEAVIPEFDHYLYYGKAGLDIRKLKDRLVYLALVVTGSFAFVLSTGGRPLSLVPLLFGLGGSATLIALFAVHRLWKQGRVEHRLFIPLSILPPRWKWRLGGTRSVSTFAMLFIVLVVPLAVRPFDTNQSLMVPMPVPRSGFFFTTRSALHDLWFLHREDTLPDLSDYVAHRAYQEGFMYGAGRDFPSADAEIAVSRFEEKDGKIVPRREVIVKYDKAWYKGVLNSARRSRLGNLLLHQGGRAVAIESAGRTTVNGSYIVLYFFVVILVFLPLLFVGLMSGTGFRPFAKGYEYRRKQQEA